MARTLDVYLLNHLVGHLIQDSGGRMVFQYVESWLNKTGATALSQWLPLRAKRFNRTECRGYFGGILPEAAKREIVAHNLGISARNDYAMLERIGGECAGAVTFLPKGVALPELSRSYRKLSAEELADILRELPKRPLLAGDEGIRLSLAGAQDKIAVRIENGEVSLPLAGAPSTHILKPAVERFEGVVFNEAFCMSLASEVGLPTALVETMEIDGMDYLVVERYDRLRKGDVIERLHQEDFCQALGIVSEHKYQKEGGPSLKQCFALVREVSSTPVIDLRHLLDAVIFNFLIGNNDAHGKNFSLLYTGVGTGDVRIKLAPLYDIVSTVYYPELNPDMAMRIGGEYLFERVTARSFEMLAEEAGLGKPLVRARVLETTEKVIAALGKVEIQHAVAEKVAGLIRRRAEKVRERFRA